MDDYKAMMLGVYLALGWLAVPVQAVVPTPEEMTEAKEWVAAHLGPTTEVYPFSFTYGGQPSRELLKTWQVQRAVRQLDTSRTQRTITFLDPRTKLQVHCEIIEYSEYPAVEWVFSFQNQGERDTPILENIQSFDVGLPLLSKQSVHFPKDAIVHHAEGSMAQLTSFRPFNHVLGPGQRLSVESTASSWALPFYNIEWESGGIITAIGWLAAPWKAEFWRDNRPLISVRTGMRESHFLLHPKEAVRMPRILLLFWKEDRIRGHNLWRRLMLDHYSPRPGGQLVPPMLYTRGWGNWSEAQHVARINWWRQHDLPMECYWIDAGWQRAPKPEEEYEYLNNAVVREDLYPNGMKAVSAAAHAQGMKFVLWWGGGNVCYPSPSRVKKVRPELLSAEHPGTDHGNPQINRWMIDYFSRAIENWDIDIYRQDSRSVAPADRGPDRVGINWARSAAGSCTFWDALLERCPHLMIDNCCGGGQNIDLETVRRSMALWRSDYQVGTDNDPIGMQGQTYGLSFWVPLSAGVVKHSDRQPSVYSLRSAYSPSMWITWNANRPELPREDFNYDLARKLIREHISVRGYFYGDYYPLTPYSNEKNSWMAWQFDRPDLGEGVVQAFRRQESNIGSSVFRLRGLEASVSYELVNLDLPEKIVMTGHALMEKGLAVAVPEQPGAVVITYKKLGDKP